MTRRFDITLGVLALLSVSIIVGLIIESDRVSDLLFSVPTWAVIGVLVAWPALILLAVIVFGRAPAMADEQLAAALERERRSAPEFEVDVDARFEWPVQSGGGSRG